MINEYRSIFEEMKRNVEEGGNPYYVAKERISEFEDSITLSRIVRNLCYYIAKED